MIVARCALLVEDQALRWQEGRSIIFDGTFHAAYNHGSEARTVLFIDLRSPLYFPPNLVDRLCSWVVRRSGYLQAVKQWLAEWERASMAEIPSRGGRTGA